MRIWSVITLAAILSCASILDAQTPNPPRANAAAPAQPARLSGRVLDPSGAVIAQASVKATQGTVVKEGKTDGAGNFLLELPPGDYRLEVTVPDFKTFQQTVRLAPNMAPLSISLVVAASTTV